MIDSKKRFGLVGRNISYSFSRGYFKKKFETLQLENHSYENFDLQEANQFPDMLNNNKDLKGLNVTIPYKQDVIEFLDSLSPQASEIGAVNTIQFTPSGLVGHNTDAYGFQKSLEPYLKAHHTKALILGTGGASKAIAYVLKELKIEFKIVSRSPLENQLNYNDLDEKTIKEHTLITNCTPLGTHPNIEFKPDLPYQFIGKDHLLFDLIYNPDKTAFLKEGESRGAQICNGLRMLELQADRAWEIWNM